MRPALRQRCLQALAVCRRITLLLLFGLSLMTAWAYWQMPKLDQLRPSIETFLKQRLHLEALSLGELSWYWAGFLWIQADDLSFSTPNDTIAYRDGAVAIRIPLFSLLAAKLEPDRIRLSSGDLKLNLPKDGATPAIAIPKGQLVLERVNLHWRYGDVQGALPGLHMLVDGDDWRLQASSAGFQLYAELDDDRLPHLLHLQFTNLNWLPASLRRKVDGTPAGELQLKRDKSRFWSLSASLHGNKPVTMLPHTPWSFPFERMRCRLKIETNGTRDLMQAGIRQAEIELAEWRLGNSTISATGGWSQQMLTLHAFSPRLAMPVMWSWLRPLGEKDWQSWLASMHEGTAANAEGEVKMPWAQPWRELPTADEWQQAAFRLTADAENADIALDLGDNVLTGTRAKVELDQSGLHAQILQTRLPHDAGSATGNLLIPWNSLELDISGSAEANAARLVDWLAPSYREQLQWQQDDSHVSFRLRWLPPEPAPREASATIQPKSEWKLTAHGVALTASGGSVQWNNKSGLAIERMQLSSPRLQGSLSLAAAQQADDSWQLQRLQLAASGDLADLAAHYDLPMAGAAGTLAANLDYDGRWHGLLDLTQCAWSNLLGSSKAGGAPYSVELEGEASPLLPIESLRITRIHSRGEALQLNGSGNIDADGMMLSLQQIRNPLFDGALKINAPFGPESWGLDVNARLLDRRALPEKLNQAEKSKPWALRADIQQFNWNDAVLHDVSMRLASSEGSIGVINAARIHTLQLDMQNLRSQFVLLGEGKIDLRRLSADVEKQKLFVSAQMEPAEQGGLRWRGFAEISGDFGHLMKRGGLSERFVGGTMHALFSGQGIAMREAPWWQDMDGRLRLRVDDGTILEGGSLTKLLAAISLADLPKLLVGQRQDLTTPGLRFERLQLEGILQNQSIDIRNVVMRSTAFDLAGRGSLDIDKDTIDMLLIARPLQNLDALLAKIPLLRDILGGAAHSLMRKVYRMHGNFSDATVESVDPSQVGLAQGGLVEQLISLPGRWFGSAGNTATP